MFEVTEVTTKGDCDLNQRKGKMIHFFDLSFDLKFKLGDNTGKIVIPEFMHDTPANELVINLDYDKDLSYDVKKMFIKELQSCFVNFSTDLMQGIPRLIRTWKRFIGR